MRSNPSAPLAVMGAAFGLFGLILLVIPPMLVAKKRRPWSGVIGLWVAGWGFLMVGVGTYFAYRGWGDLVILGVAVSVVGHVIQRRATGGPK